MTAFRAYLRVVSYSLLPDDITARLGVVPDEVTALNDLRRGQVAPRDHSTWVRHVRTPKAMPRPEDLEPVILDWGTGFATALGEAVAAGDFTVSLELVQEIRDLDNNTEKGIFFSAQLIAWLSVARASVDIDQYIYHEHI